MDVRKIVVAAIQWRYAPELIVIVILFAIAAGYAVTDNATYTPDSARYAIWAESIAEGNGFSDWTSPEPSRYVVHAPLYSVLLAPVAALYPHNSIALKFETILIGILLLIGLFQMIRFRSGRVAAGICTVILATHPLTLLYSTQVLSEILFAAFLVGLFFALEYWLKSDLTKTSTLFSVIILLIGCILSREIGIVLLIVVVAFLILKEKYEYAGWVFIGVTMIFGAWYVRNELLVAAREHPDLRNAMLFSSNILTSSEHSVVRELWMRIGVNGIFYGRELLGVLFSSQFSFSGELQNTYYQVVDRTSGVLIVAQQIVSPAFSMAALLSVIVILVGIYDEIIRGRMMFLFCTFIFLYGAMILIYPVADIRFLYPVLIVMIIFFGRGVESLSRNRKKTIPAMVLAVVGVSLVPNILWGVGFLREADEYRSDPVAYYDNIVHHSTRSSEMTKPFSLAAKWVLQNGDSSNVIISRWKELGLVLPQKKVLLLDAFVSLSTFEQSIRDYGVSYVVTTKDMYGWHEYEFQMNATKRYSFSLVHSVAGLDVFKVEEVTAQTPKLTETRAMFQYMFHYLEHGGYDTLRTFFQKNANLTAIHYQLRFYQGVTEECAGDYDTALNIYSSLFGMPQGIGLAQQVGFHTNVINQRKAVEKSTNPKDRASKYFNIALNYWELDRRQNALNYLNATIREEPTYLPAYNLFVYFSLLNQDTVNASVAFAAMTDRFPGEPVVPLFRSLFTHMIELRSAASVMQRSQLYAQLADDYDQLGLSDSKVESLRRSYLSNPVNNDIALRLAALYEQKSKYFPAKQILLDAWNRQQQSESLKMKLNEIQTRY
ncbi:MAG: hypothetical protein WCX28_07645 [Bacteriovoracaceae bacterium]